MNCFYNLPCYCVGFIIHYFLVFLVKVMVVVDVIIFLFSQSKSAMISVSYLLVSAALTALDLVCSLVLCAIVCFDSPK